MSLTLVGAIAPAVATVPDAVAPVAAVDDAYTLSSGDRINVVIANIPEYSGTYQVLVDGTVDLPVLGNVDVRGMTTREASEAIAQQYARGEILVQPVVNVILAEANIVDITITGEVNRPGVYSLIPSNGELPTLAEAIEKAGGITQQANLQQIEIRRSQRTGDTRIVQVNLWKLLSEGDIHQNVTLRDGDMIALPVATTIDTPTLEMMGDASFAASTVQVNLVGEVHQAGMLQVPPNTDLNHALLMAGGFTSRARRGSVELLRLNPNGTVSRHRIEIDFSNSVNEDTNPILRDRDVVIVGRSTLARITDTLGTVLSPIGGAFSLFNLFSPFFSPSGR
ncbi:MAG: polysaccharide biosynthesis/export family protein [Oculatellaceae cyanobacterium bins.114]|nr:polysaccharide biosynthesis/export family protein [Oculatellaceae cyanobacterium bins.114]